MLHSLTYTSSPNMNTLSNCRSEVKINEMSSNFCGCTSGFLKYAYVLNKPIGSCCLKYAGTRGGFITPSVQRPHFRCSCAKKDFFQCVHCGTLRALKKGNGSVTDPRHYTGANKERNDCRTGFDDIRDGCLSI
jgi:hypothetical protein